MILPPHLAHLPAPSAEAVALSKALRSHIVREIVAQGGWVSFARYMELALYAPGLGYYAAGASKLGESGDFITAPELSPLFAQCMARQLAQLAPSHVMELGAGSGALAADLLLELAQLSQPPERYFILEVSADLRERQRARIARLPETLARRVLWLDVLPNTFEGVVVANEVLDATPVHRVRVTANGITEIGVAIAGTKVELPAGEEAGVFVLAERDATDILTQVTGSLALQAPYETEINLSACALVTSLSHMLTRGMLLFIDYGFPAREYYHPQRDTGTLMCHYRHHAHSDALVLPGLQDITAHVDFSAVAAAALTGGAQLLGYVNQAHFLINCGITDLLSQVPARDTARYAPLAAAAQKLLSPAEMGELFKVIALGKGVDTSLLGFARGDKSHTL